MAGIANGMAYHGGMRPFVATFFCFSDYMRPSVRLAAVSELPVVFVWTHDSIGLGEDGPTHQPVEHLMSLRAMPGFTIIRPGDPNEASEAWRVAMERREGPVGLVLSRQKLPVIDPAKYAAPSGLARGAYVLAEASDGKPRLLLLATGTEVALALDARGKLEADGVPHARRLDAVVGDLRGAGARVSRRGPSSGRRRPALDRGGRHARLEAVRRRPRGLRRSRPLRRVRAGRGRSVEARLQRGERRREGEGAPGRADEGRGRVRSRRISPQGNRRGDASGARSLRR